MEDNSASKRKEILTSAKPQESPEDILLVKEASHKETNAVWFHLHQAPWTGTFPNTENRLVGARGWGRERTGVTL